MNAEEELVRALQASLRRRDVDVESLVEEAWGDARDQVRAVLVRAMSHDLLERALRVLGDDRRAPADESVEPPGAAEEVDPAAAAVVDPPVGASVVYLFGVTEGTWEPAVLAEARRLPRGGPLRTVEAAGLVAIVCDLDADVLTSLQTDTPDGLETLTQAALAHDEALATVAARGTVLPLRLGTVVTDDEAAAGVLERHAPSLQAELDRVAAHAEWTVTVRQASVPAATRSPSAPSPPQPTSTGDAGVTGRDHLEQRRAELAAREQRRRTTRDTSTTIHERLASHATEVGTTQRPGGSDPTALLHGVYLVAGTRAPAFLSEVEALRGELPELLLDVSGPLPPYHFVAPVGAFEGSGPS